MTKALKKKDEIKRQDEVSGGEPMVSGRGGIGVNNVEVPADKLSKAQRGRVEDDQESPAVKEEEKPRSTRRRATRSDTEKKRVAARKARN